MSVLYRTSRTRVKTFTVGALASALLTVGLAGAAHAADDLVLDHGHIDAFAVSWSNDQLKLQLQEDVTGSHVKHAPEDVLLKVKEEAKVTLPDPVPSNLSFLGSPGDEVYYLPQTQDPNLIWPGWSTEQVPAGVFTNPLHIQVTDVTGPGEVFLWQTGSFGQSQSVLAGGGYALPGTITANAGIHAHSNWAFTEPGTYELSVRAQGNRLDGGGAVSTETATYTFQVGNPAPVTTTLTVNGIQEHYHPGATVSLTAAQDPQTALDHYHWFTRAPGAPDWTVVPGVGGGSYEFTATEELDGTQVIARLYGDGHAVVAESAPVTVHVENHEEEDPQTTLSISGAASEYTVGETANLTAVQNPPTELDHYHWFTKAKDATEWVIVPGNATGAYSFETTAAHDGMQVVAKLYNDHHEIAAESEPITLTVKAATPPAKPNPIQQLVTSLVNALNAILGGLRK